LFRDFGTLNACAVCKGIFSDGYCTFMTKGYFSRVAARSSGIELSVASRQTPMSGSGEPESEFLVPVSAFM
jgi:hypothetical protein